MIPLIKINEKTDAERVSCKTFNACKNAVCLCAGYFLVQFDLIIFKKIIKLKKKNNTRDKQKQTGRQTSSYLYIYVCVCFCFCSCICGMYVKKYYKYMKT